MIYKVEFIGANGKQYEVTMTVNDGSAAVKQLTLVAGGCTISLASTDDVFKPIRSTSASITVRTSFDLSNLYSVGAQDVPVVITEDGAVIFRGYVEPLQLSQPLSARATELTIECVDAITTLQHIDFAEFGKSLPTFTDYFEQAMALASPDNALTLTVVESYDKTTDEMAVNIGNWFDEDAQPCKWSEVLEEILRYLNMSMIMRGDEVLVCDARTLVSGNIDDIDDVSFSGSQISKSLTEVYNRIKVNVSLYSDTSAIPELFDSDTAEPVGAYGASTMIYEYDADNYAQDYYTFYKQQGVETLHYDPAALDMVDSSSVNDIQGTSDYPGAYLIKSSTVKWSKDAGINGNADSIVNDKVDKSFLFVNIGNSMLSGYDKTKFDICSSQLGKTICRFKDDVWRVYAGEYALVLSGKISYSPELTYSPKVTLPTKLGGSTNYSKMLAAASEAYGKTETNDERVKAEDSYIVMSLKIGDKYWENLNPNNTDADAYGQWTTKKSYFRAYVALDDSVRCHSDLYGEIKKNSDGTYERYGIRNGEWLNTKQFIIRNNVRWTDGFDGKGLRIPIYPTNLLAGKLELEIIIPNAPYAGCVQYAVIEDLKLELKRVGTGGVSSALQGDEGDDDVVYENVADESSVRDGEEMTLKVATDCGRKYSRGAVILVGDNYAYAGKLLSDLTGSKQVAEEHIIEARINEYKQPRQVLEGTMRNCLVDWRHGVKSTDLGRRYVVAGATLNLDDATSKVKLIEIG